MIQVRWQVAYQTHAPFSRSSQLMTSAMDRSARLRFKPFASRHMTSRGACTSGTTLAASLAYTRRVIASDIDTLAGMLSEVKCVLLAPARYAEGRVQFASRLAADFEMIARPRRPRPLLPPGITWSIEALRLRIPEFPQLTYWFPLLACTVVSR